MTTEQTIWKFDIPVQDEFDRMMPRGARVIHVATQHENPRMWALVDPAEPHEKRTFYVHGTGHTIRAGLTHLGSFMLLDGQFVGHVFEEAQE